jgi:hypothetical protein
MQAQRRATRAAKSRRARARIALEWGIASKESIAHGPCIYK